MLEYELRFRLENDITDRLKELGFSKKHSFSMSDIVFERKDWITGQPMVLGYHIVRIRLTTNSKPRLEIKEFIKANEWKEFSIRTDDPRSIVGIFSRLMAPRKVISKERQVWTRDSIEICLDNVEHLGKFIEIEGPEQEVLALTQKLGFSLDQKQPVYGSQLVKLEQQGKIKFDPAEINQALERFGF